MSKAINPVLRAAAAAARSCASRLGTRFTTEASHSLACPWPPPASPQSAASAAFRAASRACRCAAWCDAGPCAYAEGRAGGAPPSLPAATEGPTSATAAARAPTLAANCTNTSSSDVPSARALPPALPLAWLSGVAGRLMKLPEGRDPEDDALALPGVYT